MCSLSDDNDVNDSVEMKWRLGPPHQKAKCLLLRLSTKSKCIILYSYILLEVCTNSELFYEEHYPGLALGFVKFNIMRHHREIRGYFQEASRN